MFFDFKLYPFLLFPSCVHLLFKFIACSYLIQHRAKYSSIHVLSFFLLLLLFSLVSDAEGHSLGLETIRSGRNLDTAVDLIINNFHRENDYFKVSECLYVYVCASSFLPINQLCKSITLLCRTRLYGTSTSLCVEFYINVHSISISSHVHLLILYK